MSYWAPNGKRSCKQQSFSYESPHLLCSPKVHCRVHKHLPMDRDPTNPAHIAKSCSLKIHFNTILPISLFPASPIVLITPVPATYISDFILLHFTDHPYANGTNKISHSVHIQQINRNSVHNENKLTGGQFRFHSMEVPPTDDNHGIFLVNEHFALGWPLCHDKTHTENCFA